MIVHHSFSYKSSYSHSNKVTRPASTFMNKYDFRGMKCICQERRRPHPAHIRQDLYLYHINLDYEYNGVFRRENKRHAEKNVIKRKSMKIICANFVERSLRKYSYTPSLPVTQRRPCCCFHETCLQ